MAEHNALPQKRDSRVLARAQRARGRAGGGRGGASAASDEAGPQGEAWENSCSLNAVVQCLRYCAVFRDALLRLPTGALQACITHTGLHICVLLVCGLLKPRR